MNIWQYSVSALGNNIFYYYSNIEWKSNEMVGDSYSNEVVMYLHSVLELKHEGSSTRHTYPYGLTTDEYEKVSTNTKLLQ